MGKKIWLVLVVATLSTFAAQAQKSEVGVFGGVSFYLGETNRASLFKLSRPAFGLVYRLNFNDHWSLKGNAYYGGIQGADSLSADAEQIKRNLSFKSVMIDIGLNIELNFMRFETGNMSTPFTPYIFAGVSIYKFNPTAELSAGEYLVNGELYNVKGGTYALQPLGTEGQGTTGYPDRKDYALTQPSIPFGIGFKFNIGKPIGLALEWGMRYTFTDYLDDISSTYADPLVLAAEYGPASAVLSDRSIYDPLNPVSNVDRQRGNSTNTDWYSFAGIILTYRIKNKPENCAAY